MQTIYLDISNKGAVPTIYAKQGDVGRQFAVLITENGLAYPIPEDAEISVWYDGASGAGNYIDVEDESAVSVSKNKITAKMIAQMLVNAGKGNVCLLIKTADGKEIGTWNIPYEVEARAGVGSHPAHDNHVIITQLDKTLSKEGMAADAAAVGEALKDLPAAGDGVKYTPQALTENQKEQARQNIGAAERGNVWLVYDNRLSPEDSDSNINMSAEAPITDENGEPIVGRVAFYEAAHDGACQLINVADGTEKNHAATVGQVVLSTPQTLTEAQKAQARGNIGASTYYHTEREEVGVEHGLINSEYIWGLYDTLMAEYPTSVQKKEVHNNDGTFTNFEYVISTGAYPTDGLYAEHYGADEHIKKPKYLILSGIHGTERCAALSAYRFIRDVLAGHNVSQAFLESSVIRVLPVGTPSAINLFTRENGDGIDVNRDFDSEAPAKETQAIINWMSANSDADLFIDCHNNGAINEVVAIVGISGNDAVDMAKKLALQGVDKVIPFWRDVIGYPPVEAPYFDENGDTKVGIRDVVFSYCANFDVAGTSISYALNVLGIPSITVETSIYYGNYSDWVAAEKKTYPPETIAAGAEAYGNILLEIHDQSFFGEVSNDMKTIDNKLNALLGAVNSGFRMESGVLVVESDSEYGNADGAKPFRIPCTNGAKTVLFQADDATYKIITESTTKDDGALWAIGGMGNCIGRVGTAENRAFLSRMGHLSYAGFDYWIPTETGTTCNNTDGFTFITHGVKAGTYHWTAYYWNE